MACFFEKVQKLCEQAAIAEPPARPDKAKRL
jgi:hypothetical protein